MTALLILLAVVGPQLAPDPNFTALVSARTDGYSADGSSTNPSITRDGRYVGFHSKACDLVAGDVNGVGDVFLRDTWTGTTTLVSVTAGGVQGNIESNDPAVSGDGRFVAFDSWATNLVPGDANGERDTFLKDTWTGSIELMSVSSAGMQGDRPSSSPAISADGRYVVFNSLATNLVAGDHNGLYDIFVRDRLLGTTERVSISSAGAEADAECIRGSITADGRFVVFESASALLAPGDGNGSSDVFVHDRQSGTTERISVSDSGVEGNGHSVSGTISDDGRWIAFSSQATNFTSPDANGALADVFIRDRWAARTVLASVSSIGVQGNQWSEQPRLTPNGRWVVFVTPSTNFVATDTNGWSDCYLHDMVLGFTQRVNVGTFQLEGHSNSYEPVISADGRFVAFWSHVKLVEQDQNRQNDVYLHDRRTGGPSLTVQPLVSGQTSTLLVEGATPHGNLILGWSWTGQGEIPTFWGVFHLLPPIYTMSVLADGAGEVRRSLYLPHYSAGETIAIQGYDLGIRLPTTPFVGVVQ